MLEFRENSRALTLGAEVELQVLDQSTCDLTPRAGEILASLSSPGLSKEMFRSTLELISGVSVNAHQLAGDVAALSAKVQQYGRERGLMFASAGTHVSAHYHDRIISESARYEELLDRNQWLIRRMAVYGLHVHIGMRNGDEAIRFQNFFLRLSPLLIALSASSPFWGGYHTGLASCRPTMYEAHPVSGIPYLAKDWTDFVKVYDDMVRTESIRSMKDIWWDIRPSPGYGTVELRMCDSVSTLAEFRALCAFIHSLAIWYDGQSTTLKRQWGSPPERWIIRENKWRAIRYGLRAKYIHDSDLSVCDLVGEYQDWLLRLSDIASGLNYEAELELLKDILNRGNSSERQVRLVHSSAGERLTTEEAERVVRHLVAEYETGSPIW